MDPRSTEDVTRLIQQARAGEQEAGDRLFDLVYEELRSIARQSRFVGREGETMQPTVLANEAYLVLGRRLPVPPRDQPENRATFFRAVAQAMRTILRDNWRMKNAEKRGGSSVPLLLGHEDVAAPKRGGAYGTGDVDYLDLDRALDGLEAYNKRWFDVVMHRYFAGRTIEETAALLGLGVSTVKADWQLARAWLRRELREP